MDIVPNLPPDLIRTVMRMHKEEALRVFDRIVSVQDATFSFQSSSRVTPKRIVLQNHMVISYGFDWIGMDFPDNVRASHSMWVSVMNCQGKALCDIVRAIQRALQDQGVIFSDFGYHYKMTVFARSKRLIHRDSSLYPLVVPLHERANLEQTKLDYEKYRYYCKKVNKSSGTNTTAYRKRLQTYRKRLQNSGCALVYSHTTELCPEFNLTRHKRRIRIVSKFQERTKAQLPICLLVRILCLYFHETSTDVRNTRATPRIPRRGAPCDE